MAIKFVNLTDDNVRSVVENLANYIPSEHLQGFLNVLNDLFARVQALEDAEPEA